MADVSPSTLRGFIVPDPRITQIWEAQSSYTQADPRPGSVDAVSSDSRLALYSVGDLDTGSSFDVKTTAAGHGGTTGNAQFAWKKSGDAGTLYRGQDQPVIITGFEPITDWVDGTGAGIQTIKHPDITQVDHTLICAYQDTTTGLKRLRVQTRARDAAWGSPVTVYSDAVTVNDYRPGLCVLPDGSIILGAHINDTSADESNVNVWRSTDKGATWALFSAAALKTGISTVTGSAGFDLKRIRLAYNDGQVLMIIHGVSNDASRTYQGTYIQYASSSLGGRFDYIETGAQDLFVSMPDVLSTPGGFVVAHITWNKLQCRRLSDAYVPFSNVPAIDVASNDINFVEWDSPPATKFATSADMAACVGQDGTLYILARVYGNPSAPLNDCQIIRSTDHGDTWAGMGIETLSTYPEHGPWYSSGGDYRTFPRHFSCVAAEGRIVVATNHRANPATTDNSISAIYLGGASTLTMPGQRVAKLDTNRSRWTSTYLPFDLPTDLIYNGIGAGTENVDDGYLSLSCTSGQSRSYYIDSSSVTAVAATQAQPIIVRWTTEVTAGGSSATDRYSCTVRHADGSNSYRVTLKIEATGFALFDSLATTRIDSAIVATGPREYIIALSGSSVAMWYRDRSSNADRVWTAGPSSTSLTDGGAAYATNRVSWGVQATGSATCTSKTWEFHVSAGSAAGTGLHGGFTNPDDLFGAPYAGPGFGSYIDAGLSIACRGGPAILGETFATASAYGYPSTNILTANSPSPRIRHRTTATAATSFAFALDEDNSGTTECHGLSDTLAVMFAGCNWRTATIEGYDGSSWSTVATVDAGANTSFTNSFVRYGNTLRAAPLSASTGTYLHENELAGWTAIIGTKWRRVEGNTEGTILDSSTAGKRPTITIAGIDGTEPTGLSNVVFYPPSWAVLVNVKGSRWSAFRVAIASQTTADGYIETGTISIGWARFFGSAYSWGRVRTVEPNVTTTTTPDWQTRSTVRSGTRRMVDIGWTDGIDESQLFGTAVPDHIVATENAGGKPAATARGTASVLSGLWSSMFRASAGENPGILGYIPAVSQVGSGGSDTVHITRNHEFLMGRVDGSIRVETQMGNEADPTSGEIVRVATMSITEII